MVDWVAFLTELEIAGHLSPGEMSVHAAFLLRTGAEGLPWAPVIPLTLPASNVEALLFFNTCCVVHNTDMFMGLVILINLNPGQPN